MQKLHVAAAKALVFDMPKVKILPHPEICPEGAEFELNDDESLCEGALRNGLKIEHACELSCACTTCLLYTSPSPRDATLSRMPSSA